MFFYIRRVKGRKVRFNLGTFPAVSLAEARQRAQELLLAIQRGEDPSADLARQKAVEADSQALSFTKVADRFLKEYARGKKKPLRDQTVKGYEWALLGAPTKAWAAKPLADISDRHVIEAIDRFEGAGQFASARLLRAYLRRFFRWACEKRLISTNPAAAVPLASSPSDFQRARVLSLRELQAILQASGGLSPVQAAFVQILILTGQRRRETSLMKWSDLDVEGPEPRWSIPAENAKNHRAHEVPLSSSAVTLLRGLPRLGDYVFTSDGETALQGYSQLKAKLDATLAARFESLPHWTWHDLRRSLATGMADLGIAPHVIEEVLNHVSGHKAGVAGIYNRSGYGPERRHALEAWAQTVSGNTSHAVANVVRMSTKRW